MMFEGNYYLANAPVNCKNCGYIDDLEKFIVPESVEETFNRDTDDFDFDSISEVEAECVCPECGKKFKVGISRHFDYYVDEIMKEE